MREVVTMENSNLSKKKSQNSQFGSSPEKEFNDKTKIKFLAAFDERYGIQPAAHSFGLLFKISATVLALVAIVASASVYADTKNVGADNSLYSFKRFGEKMQLVFTSNAEKPQLQAAFAVRRMDEIDDLKSRDPNSAILPQLNTDLNTAIDATVSDQAQIDHGRGAAVDLCGKVFAAIGSASSVAHDALLTHPKVVQRFEQRCGQDAGAAASLNSASDASVVNSGDNESNGSITGNANSSTDTVDSSSVSSTIDGSIQGSNGNPSDTKDSVSGSAVLPLGL